MSNRVRVALRRVLRARIRKRLRPLRVRAVLGWERGRKERRETTAKERERATQHRDRQTAGQTDRKAEGGSSRWDLDRGG